MLFNPTSTQFVEPYRDFSSGDSFDMVLNLGFADATILPNIDMEHFPSVGSEFAPHHDQPIVLSRFEAVGEQQQYDFDMNYDNIYPQGNKHFVRMLAFHDPGVHVSAWRTKPVYTWNETDVRSWIVETATNKKMNVVEVASFDFANVTGDDLLKMSKQEFCERMYSQANGYDSMQVGECMYDALQQFTVDSQYDQEAVVPITVMDRYESTTPTHESEGQILDLDSEYKHQTMIGRNDMHIAFSRGINCDSEYDSLSEEYESKVGENELLRIDTNSPGEMTERSVPLVITKRPPGRPKGSGKKHPKRIKNVSVPEFLRDLLLNPKYCPRIIKWEDYSLGKFRFVRPDEVAKLWGGKRNNEKMSFEKFSRAMRYHYKQGVLVSVPTARLVYQFGPKAPQYTTTNPNFEPSPAKFNIRKRALKYSSTNRRSST